MSETRSRGIAGWTVDLPPGWFIVPVGDLDAHGQSVWIDGVIEQLQETAAAPGATSSVRTELARVREEVMARADPWLSAAVSVRPELVMTIGCVLLTSIIGLEPGDDADAFEALLEDGFSHPGRGVRSHSSRTWRDRADAGELVGGYQRFETVRLGEGVGVVEDRTIFGLFPPGSDEMVRLEFRVSDLGTYEDMAAATGAIARSTRVELEPA